MKLYRLTNRNGVTADLMDYGATLVRLHVPDRSNRIADIVLGYDQPQHYLSDPFYLGCTVGRYANRIANGRFQLGEESFQLSTNDGKNHLHGGLRGFNRVVFHAVAVAEDHVSGVEFRHASPAGDEGYPGRLELSVTYRLSDADELMIEYRATTDRLTVVNLSHHSYFNLAGHDQGKIDDHRLWIDAEYFTPIRPDLIPTGVLSPVEGTPFDFRKPMTIGGRLHDTHTQMKMAGGYDHNFVLANFDGSLRLVARVAEPVSGRTLEVLTTEPGLQFYTGNSLDGSRSGKGGCRYQRHHGFCLETQHFPDSPNQGDFPPTMLEPGLQFESRTVYRFCVDEDNVRGNS